MWNGHTHSFQLMEWDHLGIKTLKHAIYTKNVFKKMQENQITTYFIFPLSSNFRKSIYTNYLDYFLKFQNGPFGMDKSGLSQFTMLHKAARVAKPKLVPQNCLILLETTLVMVGGRFVSEFMWGIIACVFNLAFSSIILLYSLCFRKRIDVNRRDIDFLSDNSKYIVVCYLKNR